METEQDTEMLAKKQKHTKKAILQVTTISIHKNYKEYCCLRILNFVFGEMNIYALSIAAFSSFVVLRFLLLVRHQNQFHHV